jgi:hypothetical protein
MIMHDPIEAIKEAEYQAKHTGQRQAVIATGEGYSVIPLARAGRKIKLEIVNPPKPTRYTQRQKLLMSPKITFTPMEVVA